MSTALIIVLLAAAFIVLGRAAVLLLDNLRKILRAGSLPPLLVGLLLGFLTTLPELIIGLTAILQGVPGLALGDLLGGLMVLLGLILGIGILLQGEIKNREPRATIIHALILVCLPLVMALKGYINYFDGIVLLVVYLALALNLAVCRRKLITLQLLRSKKSPLRTNPGSFRHYLLALGGALLVVAMSDIIVRLASSLLTIWAVTPLVIGMLIFSFGTNLPELIITIHAGLKKVRSLSVNHVIGSVTANILVLAVLSLFQTFTVVLNLRFYFLAASVLILCVCFYFFYTSQKKFTRVEGIVFLLIYVIFIVGQILLV